MMLEHVPEPGETLARPRLFNRETVLDRAIPLFWRNGYAATNMRQLEQATGVNKSGLYTEFENKEDLFVEALRRYLAQGTALELLRVEPGGWDNVSAFLSRAPKMNAEIAGCFAMNSSREVETIPSRARELIGDFATTCKDEIARNIATERPDGDFETAADVVWTFFAGLCLTANTEGPQADTSERIDTFLSWLRKAV